MLIGIDQGMTGVHRAAKAGTLRLGSLDAWLSWRIGGKRSPTDHSTT